MFVQRGVVFLGLLVDQVAVALAEGAAHAVLAAQADREALVQQAAEGQVFGGGPVDALAGVDGLAAVLDHPLDGLVDVEAFGTAVICRPMSRSRWAGTAVSPRRSSPSARCLRPLAVQPVGLVGLIDLAGVELGVEEAVGLFIQPSSCSAGTMPSSISRRRRVRGSRVVLDGTSRAGSSSDRRLVVAEPAIQNMSMTTSLPNCWRYSVATLARVDHRFRIVPVGVEDRRLDHQGRIPTDKGRSRRARAGGETDWFLTMKCTSRRCGSPSAHQGEAFGDHALAGEGGIAVQQQRQHMAAAGGRVFAQRKACFAAPCPAPLG